MRFLLFSLAIAAAGCTAPSTLVQTHATPESLQGLTDTYEFSQAVRVGATVWVSGQVGVGPDGIPEGIEAQTRLAFDNMEAVLAEAGASMEDVVELTSFHVSMDDFQAFRAVKSEYFPRPFPAWTAVGVSSLAGPSLLIEVRAVAVVGSGAGQ